MEKQKQNQFSIHFSTETESINANLNLYSVLGIVYNEILKLTPLYLFLLLFCYYNEQENAVIIEITIKKNKNE